MAHLRYMYARVTPRGYLPDPTKSILVVALRNVSRAEELFRGMGLKVVMGSR